MGHRCNLESEGCFWQAWWFRIQHFFNTESLRLSGYQRLWTHPGLAMCLFIAGSRHAEWSCQIIVVDSSGLVYTISGKVLSGDPSYFWYVARTHYHAPAISDNATVRPFTCDQPRGLVECEQIIHQMLHLFLNDPYTPKALLARPLKATINHAAGSVRS